jgi:hypothetical protein
MLFALAEIALDLGDKSKHAARQRESALGPTRGIVAKLAKKR